MNSNYKLDISYIAGLFAHVNIKLHKIEQIIDYYEPELQDTDDNLVDLDLEREKRR